MDDQFDLDKDVWYSGVEPIDVGNLEEVREERQVIPATKNVKLQIIKAENAFNKENTYRSINLQLNLVEGIDGKYKGKPIFTRVCYYADPNVYTKEWFTKKQHLVQLKYLKRAIGFTSNVVDGHLLEDLKGKQLLGDIIVRKRKIIVDDGAGGKEEVEQLDNEVRNFKVLPISSMI